MWLLYFLCCFEKHCNLCRVFKKMESITLPLSYLCLFSSMTKYPHYLELPWMGCTICNSPRFSRSILPPLKCIPPLYFVMFLVYLLSILVFTYEEPYGPSWYACWVQERNIRGPIAQEPLNFMEAENRLTSHFTKF